MKIIFTDIGAKKFTVRRVLNGAVKYLGQPTEKLEMSLSIVSQEEIAELNKKYRDVESVTDVLSFPAMELAAGDVVDGDVPVDAVDPDTGRVNLGDVIICLDRAKEQAKNYGHSLKRELSFLALHGLLHLLGYDHTTQDEEKTMFGLQDKILSKLGINR